MIKWFAIVVVSFSFSAFAGDKVNVEPGKDSMKAKGVVTATIPWVKEKDAKWDLHMQIQNEMEEKGIIIYLSDIGCKRGKRRGSLKYTFFNTGERTIDFKPGQMKEFNMVCDVSGKVSGPLQLSINRVYENPSLDGKTVGKVIARDLTWKYSLNGSHAGDDEKTKDKTVDDM